MAKVVYYIRCYFLLEPTSCQVSAVSVISITIGQTDTLVKKKIHFSCLLSNNSWSHCSKTNLATKNKQKRLLHIITQSPSYRRKVLLWLHVSLTCTRTRRHKIKWKVLRLLVFFRLQQKDLLCLSFRNARENVACATWSIKELCYRKQFDEENSDVTTTLL